MLADPAHGYAVTTLADSTAIKPTKANIDAALRKVMDACKAGDTVVVGLSGHGLQYDDEAYFCPSDAKPVKSRAADTMVSMKSLYDELKGSSAGVKVLLVDACRNAGSGSDKSAKGIDGEGPRPPKGVAALFSCSSGEKSWETAKLGKGHGVFFYHVMEGLKGKAKDDDEVTFNSLASYVCKRVNADVDRLIGEGAKQQPNLKADLVGTPPVLVKLASGSGTVPPVDPPLKKDPPLAGKKPDPLKAPFSAKEAKDAQVAWAAYLGRKPEEVIELPGKVKMTFVLIPPGAYTMGSPKGEGAFDDEVQHEVEIGKPFYLATTETTQAQYAAFGDKNPSDFKEDELPVENVSWDDADAYCKKLTEKAKPTWGKLFKLPTEAEWEYACRAGTETPFHFGKELSEAAARFGYYTRSTVKVGSYKTNAFGLFDMHGNVWEWCEDWYGDYGKVKEKVDPVQKIKNSNHRVCRGGSWGDVAACRSARRRLFAPAESYGFLGFRVAFCLD